MTRESSDSRTEKKVLPQCLTVLPLLLLLLERAHARPHGGKMKTRWRRRQQQQCHLLGPYFIIIISFFFRFFHSFSFAIYWWRTEFSPGWRRPPAVAADCHEPLIILTIVTATLLLSSSFPSSHTLSSTSFLWSISCPATDATAIATPVTTDIRSISINPRRRLPVRLCASTSSLPSISALH